MTDEELLTTLLRERAERVPDTGPAVDDVRRRAGRVRRRRAVTPLLAAATVAAVVCGGFVVREVGTDRPTRPVSPATAGPTTGPTSLGRLSDVRRGADPRVEYLRDGTFVDPAGGRYDLQGITGEVTSFVRFDRSRLVGTEADGAAVLFDDGGRTVYRQPGSAQFVLAPGRDAAWLVSDGVLTLQPPRTFPDPVRAPVGDLQPVGTLADDSVVLSPAAPDGGTAVELLDPGTSDLVPVPGLVSAVAATPKGDLVAGQATEEDGRLGPSVVVRRDGTRLWGSDHWRPVAFSPDGRHVVARDDATGGDDAAIGILDARTGRVVAELPLLGQGLSAGTGVVWESDRAVLVPTFEGREQVWTVLRLALDGTVGRATDVVPGTGERSPWVLGTQP